MIESQVVKNIVVVSVEGTVRELKSIAAGGYAVIVDRQEAPVALAAPKDVKLIREPSETPLLQIASPFPRALVAGQGIHIQQLFSAAVSYSELYLRYPEVERQQTTH